MKSKQYRIELTGETPLLMHWDNLDWSEVMKKWETNPANKGISIAGDDRSPAHRWIGNLYQEGGLVVMPSDNLMTVMREGGKRCQTGKRGATFKSQTQSGIIVDQTSWPIVVDGKKIPTQPVMELVDEPSFSAHCEVVKSLGFELFAKRATVGTSKHVRVRPRFNRWGCGGTVTVLDEQITEEVLKNIWKFGGAYAGLGDWRPGSPKSPGWCGKFSASITAI